MLNGVLNTDNLFVFQLVVEKKSLTAVAQYLGVSNATITNKINQLESDLDCQLMHRTTRSLILTKVGELLYQKIVPASEQLQHAIDELKRFQYGDEGEIRVTAPPQFGHQYMGEVIAAFTKLHPNVHVNLILSNENIDMIAQRYDFAIRTKGWVSSPDWMYANLKSRLLVIQNLIVAASPSYLAKYGMPKTIDDLQKHNCLHLTTKDSLQKKTWHINDKLEIPIKGNMSANSLGALIQSAAAGNGIVMASKLSLKNLLKQKVLVQVLKSEKPATFKSYILYPREKKLASYKKKFLDFLVQYDFS